MITGDFTGVLYAVIAILGVLLAGYGVALLVSFRASRPKAAQESVQPVTGKGLDARPMAS